MMSVCLVPPCGGEPRTGLPPTAVELLLRETHSRWLGFTIAPLQCAPVNCKPWSTAEKVAGLRGQGQTWSRLVSGGILPISGPVSDSEWPRRFWPLMAA